MNQETPKPGNHRNTLFLVQWQFTKDKFFDLVNS